MGENEKKITMQDNKDKIFKELRTKESELEAKDNVAKELKEANDKMMENMAAMMKQMEEMQKSIQAPQVQTVGVIKERPARKSIKLMNLSLGQCYLIDGILNVRFDKPFDKAGVTEGVFENFYNRFKPWFESLDVIILDEEIAEEFGMLDLYKKHGISEKLMENTIKLNKDMMMERLAGMIPKLQMLFVKYFATQLNNGSEYTSDAGKHYALEDHFRTNFALEITIRDIAEELKHVK